MTTSETVRLADYNRMADTYRNESDRAAAILATSFVDNTLRRLLLEYMVEHPKISALFEGDRPLATFSSRITIAFGLGMLHHDTYTDLHLLRRIRNHFAHSEEAESFSTSPVREWCAELWIVKKGPENGFFPKGIAPEVRDQFLLSIGITMLYLDHLLVGFRNGKFVRCAVGLVHRTPQPNVASNPTH